MVTHKIAEIRLVTTQKMIYVPVHNRGSSVAKPGSNPECGALAQAVDDTVVRGKRRALVQWSRRARGTALLHRGAEDPARLPRLRRQERRSARYRYWTTCCRRRVVFRALAEMDGLNRRVESALRLLFLLTGFYSALELPTCASCRRGSSSSSWTSAARESSRRSSPSVRQRERFVQELPAEAQRNLYRLRYRRHHPVKKAAYDARQALAKYSVYAVADAIVCSRRTCRTCCSASWGRLAGLRRRALELGLPVLPAAAEQPAPARAQGRVPRRDQSRPGVALGAGSALPHGPGHLEFLNGWGVGEEEKTLSVEVIRGRGIKPWT